LFLTGSHPSTSNVIGGSGGVVSDGANGGKLNIVKNGSGYWALSGINTFSGSVTVNSGTLSLAALGATNPGNTVAVNSGATLTRTGGGSSSAGVVTVGGFNDGASGGGLITRDGGGGTRPYELAGSGTYSFGGTIQDNGANVESIIKSGPGTQTFSGTNTYTGSTRISNGILRLDGSTGSLSSTSTLVMSGGQFHYDNTNSSGVKAQTLTGGTGAVILNGDNVIQSTRGGASNATLTLSATGGSTMGRSTGATVNFVYTGGTVGVDNSIVLAGPSVAAGFITQGHFVNGGNYAYVNTATSGYVRAAVYDSDAGFVTAGASLTGTSHNLVTSSIAAQATGTVNTIKFSGTGAINLTQTGALTLSNGGIIRTGSGSTIISDSTVRAANNGELVLRTDTAGDTLTINSNIIANGNNALTKSGAGTLVLGGSNTYNQTTTIDGGVLSISSNANLGSQTSGGGVTINNSTLRVTENVGLYNGTPGTANRDITLRNRATFDIAATKTLTIAGAVADGWALNNNTNHTRGSLVKTGSGTLDFRGIATYVGPTNVEQGTFLFNGSGSTTAVSVASGATLGGSGTIGNTVTIDGGQLAPGNSPGTLTINDDVTMNGNSLLTLELNGTSAGSYDQLAIGGAVPANFTLTGSSVSLALSIGYSALVGDTFTVIDNITSGSFFGTFDNLNPLGLISASGYTLQANDYGAGSNDLILTVVPEPNVIALAAVGLTALALRARAKRKRTS
jgi:autotransporter-associated beta strand protein